MKMIVIDLEVVSQSKERDEKETLRHLYALSNKAEVLFLSSEPSKQIPIQQWIEKNRLDKHKIIYKEPVKDWKGYFVNNLMERMHAGKCPPAEEIIFVDSDEQTRLEVFDRHGQEVKVYKTLADAVEEPGPPTQTQEMSWAERILLMRKALEDEK